VSVSVTIPGRNRIAPTRRQLAQLIIAMRTAEQRRLHGERDNCIPCSIVADITGSLVAARLPWWLRREPAYHRYVEMPALRADARELDERKAGL
jgi:hypothetical protein